MIYFFTLIVLFLLSSIANGLVFSKRAGNIICDSLSRTEDDRSYLQKKDEKLFLIFSFIFFAGPGFIYKQAKGIHIENSTLSLFALVAIVAISIFCLWFNIKKVKVKKFSIEKTNTDKTFELKSFFENEQEFTQIVKLLNQNQFVTKTKKPTVLELTILICKLDEIKTIKFHRKQNHLCLSIADYFKIDEFDKANLSNALKNYRQNSFSVAHQNLFDSLDYLKDINN